MARNQSDLMKRVRQHSTAPEVLVRSALHRTGFRFRINVKGLPGTPDIVLPRFRTAVFVNGCFWHGHECRAGRLPKTNVDFWTKKLNANRARDQAKEERLRALGWRVVIIWTCSLSSDIQQLLEHLTSLREVHSRK